MLNKHKARRDEFSFSLNGMMAVGGYVGIPAIAARSKAEVGAKPAKPSTNSEEILVECSSLPVNHAESADQPQPHSNAA